MNGHLVKKRPEPTPIQKWYSSLSGNIINAAMEVHSALGPGLLESAYEGCLKHELFMRGVRIQSQVSLPVVYKEQTIDLGYRLDLVVEDAIIVEIKAVEKLVSVHEAQLLSYLKLSGKKLGLLINFHELHLRDGIKRRANNL